MISSSFFVYILILLRYNIGVVYVRVVVSRKQDCQEVMVIGQEKKVIVYGIQILKL